MRQTKPVRELTAPVPHPEPRAITGAFRGNDGRRHWRFWRSERFRQQGKRKDETTGGIAESMKLVELDDIACPPTSSGRITPGSRSIRGVRGAGRTPSVRRHLEPDISVRRHPGPGFALRHGDLDFRHHLGDLA